MGWEGGDLLLLSLLPILMIQPSWRTQFFAEAGRLYPIFVLILIFVNLTLLSAAANVPTWGIKEVDLIEALRPLYYFTLIVFTSLCVRRYGLSIVISYLVGILFSGMVAYLLPSRADVSGFAMLWNPNVMGNMFAFGTILASLLIFERHLSIAAFFLIPFIVLSALTYSKGSWLMLLIGLAACGTALLSVGARASHKEKTVLLAGFIFIAALAVYNYSSLRDLIVLKFATSQFGDSAADGGTVAARWGFVQASAYLALENPIFGVGISNFEMAYDSLQDLLGDNYWASDNPHSAWLYILACIGMPALLIFGGIVVAVLHQLSLRIPLTRGLRQIYMSLVSLLVVVSGAVQLQILTQHFFWFLAGVAAGWRPAAAKVSSTE